jgi:uncharacterized protein (TIGR03437 family)
MFFTFIALLLSGIARPVEGQTMSFFKQVPEVSGFVGVAADISGVYAFWDFRVHKYDSHGNELWTTIFNPGRIIAGAADGSGVYVLEAAQPSQSFLRKYSPEGTELWARQLESGSSLAVDATGVYVAGRALPSVLSRLAKYSPESLELWTREFGDANTFPRGVAVDDTGVYVMNANSNGSARVLMRKWGIDGRESWTRDLRSSDVPRALAAAEPDGFYVIAADAAGSGTFLRKHDADGNELWIRRIDLAPDVEIRVAADATGVYLVGKMPVLYAPYRPYSVLPGQCRSGSGGDSFVRKYDANNGAELWARQFGTSQAAWASGAAVDAGGVYVVGEEGSAQVQGDFEHFEAFRPAMPTRTAFLARFEASTAVVTAGGPRIFQDCVVNAASFVGGGVAPGEIVTIFGSELGPPELAPLQVTEDRRLATTLADTRILFNGVAAPLVHVSDEQSTAIVPYGVAGRSSVDVEVEYKGVRSGAVTVPVLDSRPGIFSMDASGHGQGAILNEDGSLNSPSNPAARGSVITLYGTGEGQAAPGVEDGQILSDALPQTSLPVWVFFDLTTNEFQVPSKSAEVLYAGGVAGSVAGLLQINVRVPPDAVATGPTVPFMLIIGSHWTVYDVTFSLR